MSTTTIQLKGFKELQQALLQFPEKVYSRIERKGTLAGAKLVRDDAKQRYLAWYGGRQHTGLTRKNIRTRKRKKTPKTQIIYDVGISRYGMFAELGTQGHFIKPKRKKELATEDIFVGNGEVSSEWRFFHRKGQKEPGVTHPGTRAKPFLRPAFYNNIDKIIEVERKVITNLIEKEIGKRA